MPARTHVELRPNVLRWARERARLSHEDLAERMRVAADDVTEWERTGTLRASYVDRLAKATRTPVGYLYLSERPVEQLPLPDFRAIRDEAPAAPSPDLLDVIDEVQRRQTWYRDYLIARGAEPLDFVGALRIDTPVQQAAALVRERHEISGNERAQLRTWEDALRLEVGKIEDAGVLVMRSGIVGNNTKRALSVDEFRAFVIADEYAPAIFINGRDALGAQMFSLMHEFVHVWIGQSGVSNLNRTIPGDDRRERFTNEVAGELLVPSAALRDLWPVVQGSRDVLAQLGRSYKVSSLVILRRLYDIGVLSWDDFRSRYESEEQRFREQSERGQGGGDFYRTQRTRSSRRFATALVEDTLEGRTPWREAFSLLGVKKYQTFREVARQLGFPI